MIYYFSSVGYDKFHNNNAIIKNYGGFFSDTFFIIWLHQTSDSYRLFLDIIIYRCFVDYVGILIYINGTIPWYSKVEIKRLLEYISVYKLSIFNENCSKWTVEICIRN